MQAEAKPHDAERRRQGENPYDVEWRRQGEKLYDAEWRRQGEKLYDAEWRRQRRSYMMQNDTDRSDRCLLR